MIAASLILRKALDIALSLESPIRQATAIQNESQKENGHVNALKGINKKNHVSVVPENTVPRYVDS